MKRSWLLLAALAVVLPAAAATDMYSWTDANGVKHFSDSPPPGSATKAQKVKVKGGMTTNAPADATADSSASAGGPALAAAAGYSPDDIQRNCDIARKNLDALEARQPALDENGDPADADSAKSRDAQIEKTNQQIKLFCVAK